MSGGIWGVARRRTACECSGGQGGCARTVAGHVRGHGGTRPEVRTLRTGKGEFALGIAMGVILILISLLLNISLTFLRRRSQN